jgi:hypothetical protein
MYPCFALQATTVCNAGSIDDGTSIGVDTAVDGTLDRNDDGIVDTPDTNGGVTTNTSDPTDAGAPVPVGVPPPAVLKTVPVNPALGNYDEPIALPVIPVAVAVLPSGKVR